MENIEKMQQETSLAHDNISYIRQHTGEEEIILQLAEEAAELSHAALKFRRTLGNGNPTPETHEKALAALLEEIADVRACTEVFLSDRENLYGIIVSTVRSKISRWVKRLKKAMGRSDT